VFVGTNERRAEVVISLDGAIPARLDVNVPPPTPSASNSTFPSLRKAPVFPAPVPTTPLPATSVRTGPVLTAPVFTAPVPPVPVPPIPVFPGTVSTTPAPTILPPQGPAPTVAPPAASQ
jgi:hypothetical protein